MTVEDAIWRDGVSSWGSSFIDFTTRSPATEEAHRLRDVSELSVMVLRSMEPPDGMPFKLGGVCGCDVDDGCSIFMLDATGADMVLALSATEDDDEEPGPRG